jgi:ATP-binding cassette subfamily B protein
LKVRPGEKLAVVGPSGAGKTSMMSLLQRLYEPRSGAVFLDGTDIRNIAQKSLRSRIGVVFQEALVFNDTMRNNIAYGRPGASEREIELAARAANAHGFISRMPGGYSALAGERGSRLSTGERQRINIARALLKDPGLIILDEATSALDAESEEAVQEALARLLEGRTSFIITHRLSTVKNADRIAVLKDGSIIECGPHAELMAAGGYYASLVRKQILVTSAAR